MAGGLRSLFSWLGGLIEGLSSSSIPPIADWILGNNWSRSVICAKAGLYGLQRYASGGSGTSDVTSTIPITVTPGTTLFTSFYCKAGATANGAIHFGFSFYTSGGVFLSSAFVDSVGLPSVWTQFFGNITVPSLAATAVAVIRATGHTSGIWCVDSVYSVSSGGNFTLSSIKHFYDKYIDYR